MSHAGLVAVEDAARGVRYEMWGACPVQALGTVLGRELYFRARHDGWSFDIADHAGVLPSDGGSVPDGFYRAAEYPNASWMPYEDAVKIIDRCLAEYLA